MPHILTRHEAEALLQDHGLTAAEAAAVTATHVGAQRQTVQITAEFWREAVIELATSRSATRPHDDTPRDLADKLGRMMNGCSHRERITEFIQGMHRQHRTLQQLFTRLVCAWLESLAQLKECEYDRRNEAAVQFAKAVVRHVPEQDRCFPFI
jgi:hypothetical protein